MIPADVYTSLVERGNDMAEAEFQHQQLDDITKSILAQLTLEAKEVDGVGSMAEAKEIALSASAYRDHLYAVAVAREKATKAKVRYYATKALFDAKRTVEATQRAAMGSAA